MLANVLSSLTIHDIWTHINSNKAGYTYYDKQKTTKSRLDYIFSSINGEMILKHSKLLTPMGAWMGVNRIAN